MKCFMVDVDGFDSVHGRLDRGTPTSPQVYKRRSLPINRIRCLQHTNCNSPTISWPYYLAPCHHMPCRVFITARLKETVCWVVGKTLMVMS